MLTGVVYIVDWARVPTSFELSRLEVEDGMAEGHMYNGVLLNNGDWAECAFEKNYWWYFHWAEAWTALNETIEDWQDEPDSEDRRQVMELLKIIGRSNYDALKEFMAIFSDKGHDFKDLEIPGNKETFLSLNADRTNSLADAANRMDLSQLDMVFIDAELNHELDYFHDLYNDPPTTYTRVVQPYLKQWVDAIATASDRGWGVLAVMW